MSSTATTTTSGGVSASRPGKRHPTGRIGAGAAVAVSAAAMPWLLDPYTISLASYALVAALLAMSTHLLTQVAGLPTLGQAGYLGVGAYTAATIARHVTTNGPLQLAAAALAAGLAAALVGPVITRTRGIAFLLATWALAELAHTSAEHATALTGGGNGLTAPPVVPLPGLAPLTADRHIYLYVLACSAVLATATAILLRSRFTLVVRGIADHENRQRANGHPADSYLCTTYILAAIIAGAAGALLVASRRYVGPADLAFDVSALALLAAIIGGRYMAAAAAAAVGIVALRDLAGNQLTGHSPLLLGALFILAALARNQRIRELIPRRVGPSR